MIDLFDGQPRSITLGPDATITKVESQDEDPLTAVGEFVYLLRDLVTSPLEEVVDWIREQAAARGYSIVPDPDRRKDLCGVNWVDHAIYMNPNRDEGADVVWDLLHEFGHVLLEMEQGEVRSPGQIQSTSDEQTADQKLRWEYRAWLLAWDAAVGQFPRLEEHAADFWSHGNGCVTTYCGWIPKSQRPR